jgi:hypothetical protein
MMLPRVSCLCGERLELDAGQPLTKIDCPTCGRTIDLSPPRFDQPPAPDACTPAIPTEEPSESGPARVCPDCAGTGTCHLCARPAGSFWSELVRTADSVFDTIFGLFAEAAASSPNNRYWNNRHISSRHIQTKVCVACNGNRKCYKCRGSGTYIGA